jgi:hypothetical protein
MVSASEQADLTAAIVGGVVGGLFVIAVLVGAAIFLARRTKDPPGLVEDTSTDTLPTEPAAELQTLASDVHETSVISTPSPYAIIPDVKNPSAQMLAHVVYAQT